MNRKFILSVLITAILGLICGCSTSSKSEQNYELDQKATEALQKLYNSTAAARSLSADAKGVLVFPSIVKGGFIVGGQYGEGVLYKDGSQAGKYNSVGASWGLQAGLQEYSYALFFMEEKDLNYLQKSEGWEIGVGPTITVIDQGAATSLTTSTARKGVYAFFFGQKGLMAGIGLQGTKITKLDR